MYKYIALLLTRKVEFGTMKVVTTIIGGQDYDFYNEDTTITKTG